MGLLDQVIGNVLNSRMGGQQGGLGGSMGGGSGGGLGGTMGGGMGGASSPLVMALMALLGSGILNGGGGGLGGLLGGTGAAGSGNGGLGGMLERFREAGHGDIANSWVGHGENQPIEPHQLNEALGQDTVDDLSRQTGMTQSDLLKELSHVLPDVVNGVTPNGRLPDGYETTQG